MLDGLGELGRQLRLEPVQPQDGRDDELQRLVVHRLGEELPFAGLDPLLGLAAPTLGVAVLGDVLDEAAVAGDLAVRPVPGGEGRAHPHGAPVPAAHLRLDHPRLAPRLAPQAPHPVLGVDVQLVGAPDPGEEVLGAVVAEHRRERLVDGEDVAGRRRLLPPVGHRVEQVAVPRLRRSRAAERVPQPVGLALDGAEAPLVDEDGHPVLAGVEPTPEPAPDPRGELLELLDLPVSTARTKHRSSSVPRLYGKRSKRLRPRRPRAGSRPCAAVARWRRRCSRRGPPRTRRPPGGRAPRPRRPRAGAAPRRRP